MCLSLPPISLWPFLCILSCRKYVLLVFKLFSEIVVLFVVVVLVYLWEEVCSGSSYFAILIQTSLSLFLFQQRNWGSEQLTNLLRVACLENCEAKDRILLSGYKDCGLNSPTVKHEFFELHLEFRAKVQHSFAIQKLVVDWTRYGGTSADWSSWEYITWTVEPKPGHVKTFRILFDIWVLDKTFKILFNFARTLCKIYYTFPCLLIQIILKMI